MSSHVRTNGSGLSGNRPASWAGRQEVGIVRIIVRLVGLFLLLVAIANLAGLVIIDRDMLISPTAVVVRYTLLAIAGTGFILTRKWGFFVYLGSFALNWMTYFTVYGGQGSVGPLWLSFPIPIAIGVVGCLAWRRLK